MASFYHDAYRSLKNNKEHTWAIDKPGHGDMPPGFINNVSSLDVQPGYKLCVYDRAAQQTSGPDVKPYCFTEGVDDLGGSPPKVVRNARAGWSWGDAIMSYSLLKDCGHPNFMWDDDCLYNVADRSTADCGNPASACFTNRVTFCNNADKLDNKCLNFCQTNPGACDQAMSKHCKANPKNDECACISSPGAAQNPQCFDNRCVNLGYRTKDMVNYTCPSKTSCDTYAKYHNTVTFMDGTVEDRCKSSIPKPVAASVSSSDSSDSNIPMIILSVVLVLIVVIILYMLIRRLSGGGRSGFNMDLVRTLAFMKS